MDPLWYYDSVIVFPRIIKQVQTVHNKKSIDLKRRIYLAYSHIRDLKTKYTQRYKWIETIPNNTFACKLYFEFNKLWHMRKDLDK